MGVPLRKNGGPARPLACRIRTIVIAPTRRSDRVSSKETGHTPRASVPKTLRAVTDDLQQQEAVLREGGGAAGQERQRKLGRLPVRERLARLLDSDATFIEMGLWAAHKMYDEWGEVPAAGVVTGIGTVEGRACMVVANDASVKAGAFFPQTAKKVLRAQKIAFNCGLPLVYLVDSSGVFLPMQDEIFPDDDDFGRIFRNNAVFSAAGLPQYAAIMGNCVAGGAYLPVLCDKILITEGSALYLAGPALVKAAIGQTADEEELGGATMHAQVSGTVDFHEKDDAACLARLRSLIKMLPVRPDEQLANPAAPEPTRDPADVYDIISPDGAKQYDAHDLLACIVDAGSANEYKSTYGESVVTVYASIGGIPVGIVANQHGPRRSRKHGIQLGGVLYGESAEKAARFVMDCSQGGLPLVFFQDVQGFMVGRDAEQSGIIRSGAKLVSAVSNAAVPKITVIVGGSFGAGNYALCGKAFDPVMVYAWPGARYAVMGGAQAAETLLALEERQAKRKGKIISDEDRKMMRRTVEQSYQEKTDIRYGAARGWVDAVIAPHTTRDVLIRSLTLVKRKPPSGGFRAGVFQV
ncbi:MAG: acyl-CoA carboxylase subunit beta [Planctomycetes bacterium]|nr:acyl-CoA carboxylase subunit beta [Planctomycetota bacterium]